MFRLFECCALSFFERFVLSFSLKIERFVSDSAEIWICGLYMNTDWNSEVEIGSGLGVLIRLSIPFVIFFFRKKLLEQNPKNLYLILLNLVYVIVNILTIKVQIFGRLNTLFLFVALFNMAALYQLDSKYRKLVVFSLFLLSVFFFERNILNVYPYQTIFGQLLIH